MKEKTIESRIIQRHDIEYNWNQKSTFVPKAGELIVYDSESTTDLLPTGRTTRYTYPRIKIGDGKSAIGTLAFVTNLSSLGITANSVELNHVKGVERNIQDQLDDLSDTTRTLATQKVEQQFTVFPGGTEDDLNTWLDTQIVAAGEHTFIPMEITCEDVSGYTLFGVLYIRNSEFAVLTLQTYGMFEVKKIKTPEGWEPARLVDPASFEFNGGHLNIRTWW